MATNPTILTHKIPIQLHPLAESYTICSSRSRWPVRKLWTHPLTRVSVLHNVSVELILVVCIVDRICCSFIVTQGDVDRNALCAERVNLK